MALAPESRLLEFQNSVFVLLNFIEEIVHFAFLDSAGSIENSLGKRVVLRFNSIIFPFAHCNVEAFRIG